MLAKAELVDVLAVLGQTFHSSYLCVFLNKLLTIHHVTSYPLNVTGHRVIRKCHLHHTMAKISISCLFLNAFIADTSLKS